MVTAASGEEALARVDAERLDLVLLDVVMPGMSGYEVCQRIRADAKNGILPVVMVTALDPSGERIKGLDAGADDFLTKPINWRSCSRGSGRSCGSSSSTTRSRRSPRSSPT